MLGQAKKRIRPIRRVRAILLTGNRSVLFIKRVKPNKSEPYWVAPGGGVEAEDEDLHEALMRELSEELGATIEILGQGFVLRHTMANKFLEEYFYICRLVDFDLSQRNGPEFLDPERGEYIPEEVALTREAIDGIYIKTYELREWMLSHLDLLLQYDQSA